MNVTGKTKHEVSISRNMEHIMYICFSLKKKANEKGRKSNYAAIVNEPHPSQRRRNYTQSCKKYTELATVHKVQGML